MQKKLTAGCLLLIILLVAGCGGKNLRKAREPSPQASSALEHVASDKVPFLIDDLELNSLSQAIERDLTYFNKLPEGGVYFLGKRKFTVRDMKETLAEFREIIKENGSDRTKEEKIRRRFDFYRSNCDDGQG